MERREGSRTRYCWLSSLRERLLLLLLFGDFIHDFGVTELCVFDAILEVLEFFGNVFSSVAVQLIHL